MSLKPWHLYLLECGDGSLYTGITTDVERRLREHISGKGARYTRSHKVVGLLESRPFGSRSEALRAEAALKRLPKEKKLAALRSKDASPMPDKSSQNTLIAGLLKGEPLALSRAITAVENATEAAAPILSAIQPHLGKATIIGITGSPGVGKSTLIDALIRELRRRGKTVAVLAVDPSSPISGGAILGDRIRMMGHSADPGVFVRSLAARGHLGGLFRTAWGVVQVMDAAGPDFIIVETVGAGQSEVEVADFVQATVVVCAPGLGDDVQAIKAGILEIADILVVNKADHPLADSALSQLKAMLHLRSPQRKAVAILATTATNGGGVPALADALEEVAATREARGQGQAFTARIRRALAEAAAQLVRGLVQGSADPEIAALCDKLGAGELGLDAAAAAVLKRLSTLDTGTKKGLG